MSLDIETGRAQLTGAACFYIWKFYSLFCRSGDSDEFDVFSVELFICIICILVYCYQVIY